jgi:hypothetical protein
MKHPTRTELANSVMATAEGVEAVMPRGLDGLPPDIAAADNGAREIAILTLTARLQEWRLKPVMEALHRLHALKDWSHSFLIAHTKAAGPSLNWRDAPMRRYSSFSEFYQQELQTVFGDWGRLQAKWERVVKGKISEEQAEADLKAERAARMIAANAKDLANVSRQGQRTDLVDNNNNYVNEVERPSGNSESYALRKLRKDRRDLHARVLAGEITAHAGMVEAGFRKKRASKKLSRVELTLRSIAKMTKPERLEIYNSVKKEFDAR